jgi:CRP-like cAMP-binding protein
MAAAVGSPQLRPTATLLNDLSKDDVAQIFASASVRKFSKGRTIIRGDEPATHLFMIKTGLVNFLRVAPDGREILLTRLLAGDTFGLGTLVEKVSYIGTAATVRETEVYSWPQVWVRHFVRQHPTLALNALRISLEYIRLYSDRHLALVCSSAEDRLTQTLTQLGLRTGHQHPRGLEVDITNEHLASLADIGYFTASRLLNKWQQRGAVEKGRGKVIIRAPERMLT